jgi:hypothetical protein
MALVITSTDVQKTILGFFLTTDQNVIPLCELGIANLLVKLTVSLIPVTLVTKLMKVLVNRFSILKRLLRDWHHNALSRTHPEGPLTSKMLNKDSHESLYRS